MLRQDAIDRRSWLASSGALSLATVLPTATAAARPDRFEFCAFIKFVQSLPYPVLAQRIANLGFDGIEATVRTGGQVLPVFRVHYMHTVCKSVEFVRSPWVFKSDAGK